MEEKNKELDDIDTNRGFADDTSDIDKKIIKIISNYKKCKSLLKKILETTCIVGIKPRRHKFEIIDVDELAKLRCIEKKFNEIHRLVMDNYKYL